MANTTEDVVLDRATDFIVCALCLKRPGGGHPFARCSRCLRARYCSKTCQRADWPTHKERCNDTRKVIEAAKEKKIRLLEGDANGKLPRELDPVKNMEDMRKWSAKQRPVLAMALLHALDLNKSMDRMHKEGVCFFIELRQTDEKKTTANRFVTKKIIIMPIDEILSASNHMQRLVDHAAYVRDYNSDVARPYFLPFAMVIHNGVSLALRLSIDHERRKAMRYDPNWLQTLKIEEETGEHEIKYV